MSVLEKGINDYHFRKLFFYSRNYYFLNEVTFYISDYGYNGILVFKKRVVLFYEY